MIFSIRFLSLPRVLLNPAQSGFYETGPNDRAIRIRLHCVTLGGTQQLKPIRRTVATKLLHVDPHLQPLANLPSSKFICACRLVQDGEKFTR